MAYTFERATADRIVGCVVGETQEHVAVAFAHHSGMQGYVLAVRRDGREYAVWAVVPGPEREIVVTAGHYFHAEHYRHADAWGHGVTGAYEAAHAWWLYCAGRGPKPE